MVDNHIDYFLRRIQQKDVNKQFETFREEFNTPSKTMKEFVLEDRDCSNSGKFITYVFGKKDTILGVTRMRPMIFREFKEEVIEKKMFNLEELEDFTDLQVIYMSRVGVFKEIEGLGFGTMLRFFLDGHARTTYNHFLIYAYINESMFNSMIQVLGERGFFENYKISKELHSKKWKKYWVVVKEFIPSQ